MSIQSLLSHYERKYGFESNESVMCIDAVRQTSRPLTRFEAVVQFFPMHFRGGDVLELGAGDGRVVQALLAQNLGIRTYTVGDFSDSRMQGLKRRLNDQRVKIVSLDAENIPESEYGQYDAVVMVALIEHLIDPLRAMQSIRKLLKPGGIVYIDTPNIAKYTRRITLCLGRFPSTSSNNEGLETFSGTPVDLHDEGHLHYFTYRALSTMLISRCGFSKVIKLSYPGGRRPLGAMIHSLLAKLWPELFSELAIIAVA